MSKVKSLSCILSFLCVSLFAPSASADDSESVKSTDEKLAAYEVKRGVVEITAIGNGCTFSSSFKVERSKKAANAIKLVRVKPDKCRMKARPVSLQYSFKHLGLDLDSEVIVANPLIEENISRTASQ